jgi:hypothetical protein
MILPDYWPKVFDLWHARASPGSEAVGLRISKQLSDFRQNFFHLIPAEGTHGVTLDVAERSDLKHKGAHCFVIGCFEDDYCVVRAHRPKFIHDLHAHFLGLRHRGVASLDRVFDIADSLVSKLNQTDISSHDFFLSCVYALKLFQVAAFANNSTLFSRMPFTH